MDFIEALGKASSMADSSVVVSMFMDHRDAASPVRAFESGFALADTQ